MQSEGYETGHEAAWNYYYNEYFIPTWINGRYKVKEWSIAHLTSDQLRNRTNNPLERFNRELKERLGAHPNLFNFITKIKEISDMYNVQLQRAKLGSQTPPKHAEDARMTTLPRDYASFIPLII